MEKFDVREWFNSNNLMIMDYQQKIVDIEIPNNITKNPTVLAVAPGGGKTLMSICYIEKYIYENPNARVLVLAHGTTVLRTQYYDEIEKLDINFTYDKIESSNDFNNSTAQVVVAIPQSLRKLKKIPKFDLLIVDEAHEFYFADKTSKLIERLNVKHQLLLTGTPSKFILKKSNYPLIVVALNEISEKNPKITDLTVELVHSSYKATNSDYNRNQEINDNFKYKQKDTEQSIDNLVEAMLNRLKSIYRANPEIYASLNTNLGINMVFKELKKTMIACQWVNQANQIANYLKIKGINVVVSTGESDLDSNEINKFKNDENIEVLIVVRRGILGFNFPEMVNVVDMTMSMNIDRIYQLLCRVVRSHPNKNTKKIFFKVAPPFLGEYMKHVMTATLCLTDRHYLSTFNGKNFDIRIPIIKLNKKIGNSELNGHKNKISFTPIDFSNLPAINFFRDILHKDNIEFGGYSYTRLGIIKSKLFNLKINNSFTKEECHEKALLCAGRKEFQVKYNSYYMKALSSKWLDDICSHMVKKLNYWTKEECHEKALLCKTRTEFSKKYNIYSGKAYREGWLDEICSHMENKKNFWTKEDCHQSALLYNTRTEFINKCKNQYNKAKKEGWLDDICSHMIPHLNLWTKEECHEKALLYKSKKAFQKECFSQYYRAKKEGWLDDICSHMKNIMNFWTKEECHEKALLCQTRNEFQNEYRVYYRKARSSNWLDEICSHMDNVLNYWTKEECAEKAKLCKSKKEFEIKYPKECRKARIAGWLDDMCTHMKILNRRMVVRILNNDKIIYDSLANAAKSNNITNKVMTNICQSGGTKSKNGLKFMYLEDYEKQYGKI